jgi:hypothetical protein
MPRTFIAPTIILLLCNRRRDDFMAFLSDMRPRPSPEHSLDRQDNDYAPQVNWMGANLPADKKQGMMAGQAANFQLFKKVCETNPA